MLLDRAVKVPFDVALPLFVVLALTALACTSLVLFRSPWPGRVLGALVVASATWWELSNSPVEGKVLVAAGRGHGVRVADVIALQALLIGVALVVGPRRSPVAPPSAR
jgi:hypothetical protein